MSDFVFAREPGLDMADSLPAPGNAYLEKT